MNRSIHDNHLYAYEVDSGEGRIILRTEYAYGEEPFEKTDVIFEGVLNADYNGEIVPI